MRILLVAVCVALNGYFLWTVRRALRSGVVATTSWRASRDETPVRYWVTVLGQLLLGVLLLPFAIWRFASGG